MGVQVDGRVGPAVAADSAYNNLRLDKQGALVVADGHGHWSEAAVRRALFTAYLKSATTTPTAGQVEAAAAAAVTQFAVWNPAGSAVNLVLQKLVVTQQSGTPTAGGLSHSKFNASAVAASLATAGAINNNYLGGPAGSGLALAVAAGTALTGGGALSTVGYTSMGNAATAAAGSNIVFAELIDGAIVVPPGMGYVPTWTGVGTTFVVGYSLTWEEVAF